MRLAVLASGRGSNLQAILDAIATRRARCRRSSACSPTSRDAPALEHARQAGIAAGGAVAARLRQRAPITMNACSAAIDCGSARSHRLCRIYAPARRQPSSRASRTHDQHPSLAAARLQGPAHAPAGARRGAPTHGASVHYVTPELDGGPVIAQARVPVQAGDDAQALAARVLRREHPLLVATLRLIAAGRMALISGQRAASTASAAAAPLPLDDANRLGPGTSHARSTTSTPPFRLTAGRPVLAGRAARMRGRSIAARRAAQPHRTALEPFIAQYQVFKGGKRAGRRHDAGGEERCPALARGPGHRMAPAV